MSFQAPFLCTEPKFWISSAAVLRWGCASPAFLSWSSCCWGARLSFTYPTSQLTQQEARATLPYYWWTRVQRQPSSHWQSAWSTHLASLILMAFRRFRCNRFILHLAHPVTVIASSFPSFVGSFFDYRCWLRCSGGPPWLRSACRVWYREKFIASS